MWWAPSISVAAAERKLALIARKRKHLRHPRWSELDQGYVSHMYTVAEEQLLEAKRREENKAFTGSNLARITGLIEECDKKEFMWYQRMGADTPPSKMIRDNAIYHQQLKEKCGDTHTITYKKYQQHHKYRHGNRQAGTGASTGATTIPPGFEPLAGRQGPGAGPGAGGRDLPLVQHDDHVDDVEDVDSDAYDIDEHEGRMWADETG